MADRSECSSRPGDLDEIVDRLAQRLTLTTAEVADWHFADAELQQSWDRPLVKLLRFFVGDGDISHADPFGEVVDVRDDSPIAA